MPIKTDSLKKNALLNRDEYILSIDHSGKPTPKRAELLKEIAKELKKPEDCIIIDKIFTEFGRSASKLKVQVYEKKDDIPKAKLEKMKVRIEGPKKKEAAKPAPAPAAALSKEKPSAEEKPAAAAEKKKEEEKPKIGHHAEKPTEVGKAAEHEKKTDGEKKE